MGHRVIHADNGPAERAGLAIRRAEVSRTHRRKVGWTDHLTDVGRLARSSGAGRYDRIIGLSIAFHPGFLILDSVHFQYNAFLFGLMIWSLVGAKEGKPTVCAGAFATLLMFK